MDPLSSDVSTKPKLAKPRVKTILILLSVLIFFLAFNFYWWRITIEAYQTSVKILWIPRFVTAVTITGCLGVCVLYTLKTVLSIKVYNVLSFILSIPLLPLIIIGSILSTKIMTALTLPIFVLLLLSSIIAFMFNNLRLLHLGSAFDHNVIPYLISTSTMMLFVYFDKFWVKIAHMSFPEQGMPREVLSITNELLNKKPFMKLSYLFLTLLLIVSSIVKLGKFELPKYLEPYTNIVLESLVTFAVVDRLISKLKS